jgi:hypothetical protein
MANVRGITMVLEVGDVATNAATYALLEGQTGITFSGAVDFADTTDKGNAGWSTSAATTRSGTISVSGNLMEASGRTNFDKLKAAWLAGTTYDCQIVIDTAGNGWQADFYVGIDSLAGEVRDVGKYTITLTPSAALVALVPVP